MSNSERNPLVSLGFLVYNRANYLREILNCWLGQTFLDFELIISDDASPEAEVQKICEEYARKDARIRYFRQKKNLGILGNQKFLLQKARGRYFMWVENDDLYDRRFLEDCLRVFKRDAGLVMVSAGTVDIDKNGRQFACSEPAKYMPLSKGLYERLKEFIYFYFSNGKIWLIMGLWKKEILSDEPLFGYREKDDRFPSYWAHDVFCTFRNLTKGPFGFVPETRHFRRSRVLEEYRPPRPLLPRLAVSLYHRLEKILGLPYFWYIFRCIWGAKELSSWQKLKLSLWNVYVMARLFFVRKI